MPLSPDILSRRGFLKLSGGSVASAFIPGWLLRPESPQVPTPWKPLSFEALWAKGELKETDFQPIYFPETGQHLDGIAQAAWRFYRHGSMAMGRPRSQLGPRNKQGDTALYQVFDRAVLRIDPARRGQPGAMSFVPLGELYSAGVPRSPNAQPFNPYFYEKYGGLAVFGAPISSWWEEQNPSNPKDPYDIIVKQYFANGLVIYRRKIPFPPEMSYAYDRTSRLEGPSPYTWGHPSQLILPGRFEVLNQTQRWASENGIDLTPIRPRSGAVTFTESLWDSAKRISVSLPDQTISAYEGQLLVSQARVSTGLPPKTTQSGNFAVIDKWLTFLYEGFNAAGKHYYLPQVPWNLRLSIPGLNTFLHATYWHNDLGRLISAGCVNQSTDDAKWLYEWARVGTPCTIA